MPEFNSQTSIDALNKLLEIRERTSSNEYFKSNEVYIVNQMYQENILFSNFYSSLVISNYSISALPGKNDGINASIIGGFNIGINKYINDERKAAAVEVIKYLSSEAFQKNFIVKQSHLYSSISKLYDDNEVCQVINCDMMKEIQFYLRPSSVMQNYDDFSNRAVKIFYEFLDGKKSIEDTLNGIEDINKIYYFTMKSIPGAIIMVLLNFLFLLVVLSTSMLFIPKIKNKYFNLLSIDLWIVYTIGTILMFSTNFEYFGKQSTGKCMIRHVFSVLANGFIYIAILYKLLVNYPKINKVSEWLRKHSSLYIIIFISIQMAFSIVISYLETFKIEEVNYKNDDLNFEICSFNNRAGETLYKIQSFLIFLLYLVLCFLIFLEWNMTETYFDLRHVTFVMIIDGINIIINNVLDAVDFNDYILYSTVHIAINLLFVFMNHIYMFIIR
eukprot:jgi/Orpsp1_1/1179692/evm.model.c7180000070363.1